MTAKPAEDSELHAVALQVLDSFFDTLASTKGMEEIAVRLKDEIVTKGTTSEAALKRALFNEEAP